MAEDGAAVLQRVEHDGAHHGSVGPWTSPSRCSVRQRQGQEWKSGWEWACSSSFSMQDERAVCEGLRIICQRDAPAPSRNVPVSQRSQGTHFPVGPLHNDAVPCERTYSLPPSSPGARREHAMTTDPADIVFGWVVRSTPEALLGCRRRGIACSSVRQLGRRVLHGDVGEDEARSDA